MNIDKSGISETSKPEKSREFSAKAEARRVLRTARAGALATVSSESGGPFASLVTVATDPAGNPLLLLSDLAVHTRNARHDPRIALLLDERGEGDPMSGVRLSVGGKLVLVDKAELDAVRSRFLARHPSAAGYAGFGDFNFYRLEVDIAHLVAGFGRIVDMAADDLLIDCSGAEELLAAERGAVDHMNEDHADALALYAERLLGADAGAWRATGLDPEGMDLAMAERTCRLVFPSRVNGPGPLRAVLKQLADKARDIT